MVPTLITSAHDRIQSINLVGVGEHLFKEIVDGGITTEVKLKLENRLAAAGIIRDQC